MPVSAIIPAFNEEKTIGEIIKVLAKVDTIEEIIVVSDGSRDRTASIARELGTTVIELPQNMGKGAAIKKGLEVCKSDIVLLLDADLIGLREIHIRKLLEPVIKNQCDMTVGVFNGGRISTDLAQKIAPQLSGQRAVRKSIINNMEYMEKAGYGIEVTLTRYAKREKIKVIEVKLKYLSHVTKEEKYGIINGFNKRLKMYWEIYKCLRPTKRLKYKGSIK
ncbi:MAG: glycosyltransferase family 2 protein [Firmicutes bacterium]|nr:glycosyltransferase family 2 protein [Bacillota bacterium]